MDSFEAGIEFAGLRDRVRRLESGEWAEAAAFQVLLERVATLEASLEAMQGLSDGGEEAEAEAEAETETDADGDGVSDEEVPDPEAIGEDALPEPVEEIVEEIQEEVTEVVRDSAPDRTHPLERRIIGRG